MRSILKTSLAVKGIAAIAVVLVPVGAVALASGGGSAEAPKAAAKTERFSGKTSQRLAIKFAVKSGKLSGLGFKIKIPCSDASFLVADETRGFDAVTIDSKGRFSTTQLGGADRVAVSGQIKKKKASGTIRVTNYVSRSVKCNGTARFTAKTR